MKPSIARTLAWILVVALLAGCGHSRVVKREGSRPAPERATQSMPRSGDYEVKRGDTLYGIAFRHGLDYREVAALNRIGPPYTIYPGQRLRLQAQGSARPAQGVTGMPAPRTPAPAPAAGTAPG
ncbi:M23 family metallopeptidase, partial [Arenimonas donghaensis]